MFARLLTKRLAAAAAPAGFAMGWQAQTVSAQAKPAPPEAASPAEVASLPASDGILQRLTSLIAANPIKTVFGASIPMYVGIFMSESTSEVTKDMPLSKRLIHTRLYGQAIAIVTTIVVWKIVHSQNDQNAPFVGGPMLEKELSRHASSLPPRGVEPPNSNSHTERGLKGDALIPLAYFAILPPVLYFLRSRVSKETLAKVTVASMGVVAAHSVFVRFGDSTVQGD